MRKHFVIFFSPGTFVAETTEKPIDSWNIDKAVEMSREVKQRYDAIPYGFCFTTRERKYDELDSKEIKRSGTYFLGGKILTIEDLRARNDPKDKILISNMECNHWNRIIENNNSWKWVQPLRDGDVIVPFEVNRR